MTGREQGFLLLTSQLGNPDRKILTPAQLRELAKRVRTLQVREPNRDLEESDLLGLGYGREMAQRIVALLSEEELLAHYCRQGEKSGCLPLSRVTPGYPQAVWQRLELESPGCLWTKGDLRILEKNAVALVGSRELSRENELFAKAVGYQAARQGFVLVSGNARGADRTAQEACLEAGGCVISVVADSLQGRRERERVLYISEDGFDQPFSAQRAISRNRVIHSMGQMTFVAQCGYQTGGTWDGTVKNLRFGWSPVYCYGDGSPAMELLSRMGAMEVDITQLENFDALPRPVAGLF